MVALPAGKPLAASTFPADPAGWKAVSRSFPWRVEGNQINANFGWSVASAGDVNGDGYDDLIVGAPLYDDGEFGGAAFVYHGSAAGPSSTPDWMADGDFFVAFGHSVGSAGDVNGDGYDDVIVGAPGGDVNQENEGLAFVYHGSAAGLSPIPDWTAGGDQPYANFGHSVGSAGDVNGDGYDDVIVGAHLGGDQTEGQAFVYHGSAAGLSSTPNWAAQGDQPLEEFGIDVGTAGDVNGDGYDDIIVGAWLYADTEFNEGRALVYQGSPSGPSLTPDWTAESDQASAILGYSVGTAGDVNDDGFDDVIVGALGFDDGEEDEGRVFAYQGSAQGLSVGPSWTAESDEVGANLGGSVASAGDVNGDGYDDVIVGAAEHAHGQSDEGGVVAYRGSAEGLSLTRSWAVESDEFQAFIGISVASAGDVNGDGYDDVIVGAPYHDDPGQDSEGGAVLILGRS